MFVVNRLGKLFFGDKSKETIIEIPDGQLYIVRPLSPKGYSELIYKDAQASIRRTTNDFQYQLIINRVFEQGEEELLDDEVDDSADVNALMDEQSFLLDEAIQFRVDIRDTGEKVFAWIDLSGASGDLWEFVCDSSTKPETVETFELFALRCQYERKYRKSAEFASEDELQQFIFSEEPIPPASPAIEVQTVETTSFSPPNTTTKATVNPKSPMPSTPSKPGDHHRPKTIEVYAEEVAELHKYDFSSETFTLKDSAVAAIVTDVGKWNYWLQVSTPSKAWISRPIEDNLSPVFNFEYLSAIFNVEDVDETGQPAVFSWLLRFSDNEHLEKFSGGLMKAIWEHNNQTKWLTLKTNDQDYITEAFQDLEMKDVEEEEAADTDDSEDEEIIPRHRSEEYDSDESQDDEEKPFKDGNVNSQLVVGQKHDRSFVVRGSKIGVFKNTDDNQLQFVTNISKVQTPSKNGKLFSPKKIMLHSGDQNMILQNADNPNSVYRLDLEAGKVVDEWKVSDKMPINSFAPEKKFATDEQTFLGFSKNAMYRVDPRLAGDKLVDANLKQYASKTGFTTAVTTEQGYIAVGSEKGDIRLFDRLGVIAKTALPSLGNEIIGLDTSADGRYLLATTKNYLLLIDTKQKEGKNEGKLGYEKAFAKDSKPQPKRLALTPSHVAQYFHETKSQVSFTAAKFNTGPDSKESTIITSTGPFVISWSLDKVLKNQKDPYSIKRYMDEVKADNFRFGSDKGIIVALPNEVDMVMKKALKRPTRDSMAPPTLAGRRSSARKNYLGRNDIVNSPY